MDQPPQTLPELIAWIRKNPGVVLGQRSLVLLEAFLNGWTLHRNNIEENRMLLGFTEFCQKRFKLEGSQGWQKIIDFKCFSDEAGWTLFEKLWDQYTEKLQMKVNRRPRKTAES